MKLKNICRFAVDNMLMRKKKALAVIAVSFISFLLVGILLGNYIYSIHEIIEFRRFMGKEMDSLYVLKFTYFDPSNEEAVRGIVPFAGALSDCEGVKVAGWMTPSSTVAFQELRTDEFLRVNQEYWSGGFAGYANVHYVSDIDYLKTAKVGYQLGDVEPDVDTVPILAGSAYRDILSIGDILSQRQPGDVIYRYQVVGFLEEGTQALPVQGVANGAITGIDSKTLDYYFVAEADYFVLDEDSPMFGTAIWSSIYWKIDSEYGKTTADRKATMNRVQELAKEYGLSVTSVSMHEACDIYMGNDREQASMIATALGFFVLVALIAITTSITVSLLMRQQDLGVMYANGISTKDLCKMIVLENTLKLSAAFLLFVLFYHIYFLPKLYDFESVLAVHRRYTGLNLVGVAVLAMVMVVISSILPMVLLMRKNVVELLHFRG